MRYLRITWEELIKMQIPRPVPRVWILQGWMRLKNLHVQEIPQVILMMEAKYSVALGSSQLIYIIL